jgi:hypothetical protein
MSTWKIVETETFADWFARQDEAAQEDVYEKVRILATYGPQLGRPLVDTVKGSRHKNMKELRVQSLGRPLRIFFAFDRKRRGVLLIGGNKTGDKRFYETMIPKADKLLDNFLEDDHA